MFMFSGSGWGRKRPAVWGRIAEAGDCPPNSEAEIRARRAGRVSRALYRNPTDERKKNAPSRRRKLKGNRRSTNCEASARIVRAFQSWFDSPVSAGAFFFLAGPVLARVLTNRSRLKECKSIYNPARFGSLRFSDTPLRVGHSRQSSDTWSRKSAHRHL